MHLVGPRAGACLAGLQARALYGLLYGSPCIVVPGSWRRKVENEEPGIPLVLVQTKLDLLDQAVVSRCRTRALRILPATGRWASRDQSRAVRRALCNIRLPRTVSAQLQHTRDPIQLCCA
jgi:hypothetical protein